VLGPTKTSRNRRLAVRTRLTPSHQRPRRPAVTPVRIDSEKPQDSPTALHRLRHSVGTYLVGEGKILKAQARVGHRDLAATLHHYAHATSLDDEDVADKLDARLNAALDEAG